MTKRSSSTSSGERRRQNASRPGKLSGKGWWDVLHRVKDEQSRDNLLVVAAGVAFFWFLSIFPAMGAAVSIYALAADPQELQRHVEALGAIMPQQAYAILRDQLDAIVRFSGGALSLGVITGLVLALWSANKGMKALMMALNIVNDEEESRGFLKLNGLSLLLTMLSIVFGLVAITLVVAVPALVGRVDLPGVLTAVIVYLRWPLLAVLLMVALGVAYWICPDRDGPRWQLVSWGSVAATLLWLLASVLFSFWVTRFGAYSKIYGSMAAVIILMLWFLITAYSVLLGGELNAAIEQQTDGDARRRGSVEGERSPEPGTA